MKPFRMKRQAFTLIELLVVIAIIGILVGLLLPALSSSRKRAKVVKARTEVRQIETAWKSYYNDYRSFPFGGGQMDESSVRILRGDAGQTDNPRRTRYIELSGASSQFEDPWHNVYKFQLKEAPPMTVHGTSNLYRNVAVWSMGPDGKDDEGYRTDDITSW